MKAGKSITLRPIRPSAALQARLQRELLRRYAFLKERMEEVISLFRKYRHAQEAAGDRIKPVPGFSDAAGQKEKSVYQLLLEVQKRLKQIKNDFNKAFPDKDADQLAKEFVQSCGKDVMNRNSLEFNRALKDFTVKVQMTEAKRIVMKSASHEAAGLIKNLGVRAQSELEGAVNRCLMEGRNIGELTEAIEQVLGVTRRRAINLAFDQTNKIEAAMDRQVKLDLGLNKAIWRHSHAWVKTEPRKSHVAADGREFDLRKGCKIDGEFIQPGEKPYCGCFAQAILKIPGGK